MYGSAVPERGGDGDRARAGQAPREVRLLAEAGRIGALLLGLTLMVDVAWFDDPSRPEEVRRGPGVPTRPAAPATTPAPRPTPPGPSPSDAGNCLDELPPDLPTSPPSGYPTDRPWPPFSICPDGAP